MRQNGKETNKDCNIRVRNIPLYSFFKRCFDIFNSLLAIIVLGLPMLIVGIIVVCESKGPMIYKSERVGEDGKIFMCYKFRSMCDNADKMKSKLLNENEVEGGITFKMENDPRITKFGKFIRKTSIDELPQLFNILKGDMSIIGPRPAIPSEVEKYSDKDKQRLLVPQGLSGLWQVSGRSETTFDEMIDLDLEYIEKKRGFFFDIWLIIKTVWVVLTQRGAE